MLQYDNIVEIKGTRTVEWGGHFKLTLENLKKMISSGVNSYFKV